MSTIAILHHNFNKPGGGERVALSLMQALKKEGYRVVLGTYERTDWTKLHTMFSVGKPVDEEVFLSPLPLTSFVIYQRMLTALLVPRLRRKADVVINTHGDILALPVDVTYVHFPMVALLSQLPDSRYKGSLAWTLYFRPYQMIQSFVASKTSRSTLVLTNSKFTASTIERELRVRPMVVYPPCDTKLKDGAAKEDSVVSVSRLVPEKNLGIIPRIAMSVKTRCAFHIVGTTEKTSPGVMKELSGSAFLHPDASFAEKSRLLLGSKVFLHAMINEHFGISIIEAMASGCVPVVHRSGGPWLDILDGRQGKHGFAFRTPNEAAEYIDFILQNDTERKEIVERNRSYISDKFSEAVFQGKMLQVVKSLCRAKAKA